MKFVLIAINIFFIGHLTAQGTEVIGLWPHEPPSLAQITTVDGQTGNIKNHDYNLNKVLNPFLTVFEPKNQNESKAGIIICTGAGDEFSANDKDGFKIAKWLTSLGYTAFMLSYSVSQNLHGALEGVQRSIRLVRSNAAFYNVDAQKIGVLGLSEGGYLTASAATTVNQQYSKVDSIDNVSSRPNFAMLINPSQVNKEDDWDKNFEFKIGEITPPFFIYEMNDTSPLADALRDHKVPLELHLKKTERNGQGSLNDNLVVEKWPILAEKWMANMFKSREIAKYQRKLNFPKKEERLKRLPKKDSVWVFLMAGQSNMAGRGFVEPQDTISTSRILTINKNNHIIKAKEPLHFYELSGSGLDCGLSFAKGLLMDIPENNSILLIPTAVGGSSIDQWIGDSIHRDVQLLSNFKEKIALAKKYGTIKGILWHQGESDANKKNIPNYDKHLTTLFTQFRTLAGDRKLPILVGELGGFRKNSESWVALNGIIHKRAKKDKFMYVIDTSDLNHKGDNLHFDSHSQRRLGQRYARVFGELIE